jgi:hypothetical protein
VRSKEVHERTEQQLQRIADNVEILVYHMNDWGPAVHTLVSVSYALVETSTLRVPPR